MDDLKIAIAGVGTVGNVLILLKKQKKLKRKLVEKLKLPPLLQENQEI